MADNKFTRGKPNTSKDSFFQKSAPIKPTANKKSGDFSVKSDTQPKRKFDKSKWRQQKYSKKNKLENWMDKREEYMRHSYQKEQNRQNVKFDVQKIYEEEEERRAKEGHQEEHVEDTTEQKPQRQRKKLSERMLEMEKDEKEKRREESLKKKAEKEEALKKYRKEKNERYKKLNKKTKKGQPVMKGRIEYLLEKIQKSLET